MRRTEFTSPWEGSVRSALADESFGLLGIEGENGYNRPIPLHFVLQKDDSVVFHGARDGEKFRFSQRTDTPATFTIFKALSLIPSYWTSTKYACPATSFYLSAYATGNLCIINGGKEKATVLQALMEKYQPEGGYEPIRYENPMYVKPLRETAVFRFTPHSWQLKCKAGQNMNASARRSVIRHLEDRNTPLDRETAEWMKRFGEKK